MNNDVITYVGMSIAMKPEILYLNAITEGRPIRSLNWTYIATQHYDIFDHVFISIERKAISPINELMYRQINVS